MKNKIYDSKETLMAGLKAEQETIIEYTRYLELAKQNNNESEVKLWEHIIKDEEEHAKEFQNALAGNFKLLDEEISIREKPQEEISKEKEIKENFEDDIVDILSDNNIKRSTYIISEEDPHYYVDFGEDKIAAKTAYSALRDSFIKCDYVEDEEMVYIHILRR